MFYKLFLPWRSAFLFDDDTAFHAFLRRKNRRMNAERIVLLLLAFLGLLVSYAADLKIGNVAAVCALVIAALLTLMIAKNEKICPAEEAEK